MQTIGERLEEARKRKGISIREAAEATKIRGDYLQKFENNQYDFNLAELYVRGFLRSYAQFLKLPADKIVNDFNSLGHATTRPRQPSREVYGRMDLSVATAGGAATDKEEPAGTPDQAAGARRSPGPFARPGSGMPPGPMIDPNLVLKGGLIVIGIIIAALLVWAARAMFFTPQAAQDQVQAAPPAQQTAPAQAAREYELVALEDVTVTVWRAELGPPARYGQQLFSETIERGRTRRLQYPGPYFVQVSAPNGLSVQFGGQRVNTEGRTVFGLQ